MENTKRTNWVFTAEQKFEILKDVGRQIVSGNIRLGKPIVLGYRGLWQWTPAGYEGYEGTG